MTHEPGPAWRRDRFDDLERELGQAAEDLHAHAIVEAPATDGEAEARRTQLSVMQRRAQRSRWLLSVARELRGDELALILGTLYEPHELAWVLGILRCNVQFTRTLQELWICGVPEHAERDVREWNAARSPVDVSPTAPGWPTSLAGFQGMNVCPECLGTGKVQP